MCELIEEERPSRTPYRLDRAPRSLLLLDGLLHSHRLPQIPLYGEEDTRLAAMQAQGEQRVVVDEVVLKTIEVTAEKGVLTAFRTDTSVIWDVSRAFNACQAARYCP